LTASNAVAEPQPRRSLDAVAQAQRFLRAVSPKTKDWLFLTYEDYKCADPVEGLTTKNRGNIGERWLRDILKAKNRAGAGVYVKLNKTLGDGLKAEDVTHIRAVMLDLDGAPLEPVLQCALPPHAITETSPDMRFGRDLRAALPQVTARGRSPKRFYQGIALNAEGAKRSDAWLDNRNS
jgi:hypothetical protein